MIAPVRDNLTRQPWFRKVDLDEDVRPGVAETGFNKKWNAKNGIRLLQKGEPLNWGGRRHN